ncbi:hypothetical protein E3O42_09590 [Cryobacterium adonitolivorans]|uniref:ScoMcrA-like SRA domain-containing protein n=1 Tax=Cryobacterium adonitolivorans TaxID=1259189 RepID=A0A4R8W3A2_9MICO|nr:hypothetical protein [Cryobacterium adonitolivorans]TFC01617.1 hypothetical protein E3O42_09590 [Cryobacterium adonitolivorans]
MPIEFLPAELPPIDEPTLILVINQAYESGSSMAEVFEATRGHWRVGPETRETTAVVLGVAGGIVRGVFRPSTWFPSPMAGQEGRWGFDGAEAPELSHLVGTSVSRLPVRKGASNPVRLYMNGLPEAGSKGLPLVARWELVPGDYLGRQERQDLYGGATFGGIQPSALSPNVFLYSDPAQGSNYGYEYDGWNEDGSVFFYTGEGRTGDQRMRVGNQALRDHSRDERDLRVFIADGFEPGTRTARQQYIGQFKVDPELPFETQVAPDQHGQARSVFVFRLLPLGPALVAARDRSHFPIALRAEVEEVALDVATLTALTREIDIEAFTSVDSAHEAIARTVVVHRPEAELVLVLRGALEARDHRVHRHHIRPAGQSNSIYTDLFDATTNVLFEAKSDSSRESVRMAIGQLLDYRRFMPADTRLAVLVPTKPARDLLDLLRTVDIEIWYPNSLGEFDSPVEIDDSLAVQSVLTATSAA